MPDNIRKRIDQQIPTRSQAAGKLYKAEREKDEPGWRCPFCGHKYKMTFEMNEHLSMSADCLKADRRGD